MDRDEMDRACGGAAELELRRGLGAWVAHRRNEARSSGLWRAAAVGLMGVWGCVLADAIWPMAGWLRLLGLTILLADAGFGVWRGWFGRAEGVGAKGFGLAQAAAEADRSGGGGAVTAGWEAMEEGESAEGGGSGEISAPQPLPGAAAAGLKGGASGYGDALRGRAVARGAEALRGIEPGEGARGADARRWRAGAWAAAVVCGVTLAIQPGVAGVHLVRLVWPGEGVRPASLTRLRAGVERAAAGSGEGVAEGELVFTARASGALPDGVTAVELDPAGEVVQTWSMEPVAEDSAGRLAGAYRLELEGVRASMRLRAQAGRARSGVVRVGGDERGDVASEERGQRRGGGSKEDAGGGPGSGQGETGDEGGSRGKTGNVSRGVSGGPSGGRGGAQPRASGVRREGEAGNDRRQVGQAPAEATPAEYRDQVAHYYQRLREDARAGREAGVATEPDE